MSLEIILGIICLILVMFIIVLVWIIYMVIVNKHDFYDFEYQDFDEKQFKCTNCKKRF